MSDPKWQEDKTDVIDTSGAGDKIGVGPDQLHGTITTNLTELWEQNEQLFQWLLDQPENYLLRTVPGGGKSYCKERLVPELAADTERTFILATTEYRNRQETYQNVLETVVENDLKGEINVVYIPSARETYGNIPQLRITESGGLEVHTPDDNEAVCQTYTEEDGEYVYPVASEIDKIVSQGATTGTVHKAVSGDWRQIFSPKEPDFTDSPLECQQRGIEAGYDPTNKHDEPACRHRRMMQRCMGKIEKNAADIIICGVSWLNVEEVVDNATVITDEDAAGELFKEHSESYLETATESFLSAIEVGPNGYRGGLRASQDRKSRTAEHIRTHYAPRSEIENDDDREPLVNQNVPVKPNTYDYSRAESPLLTLALMEGEDTEETNHIVFDPDDLPYTVVIDLQRNRANNSHDHVAVANPPDALHEAEQVIALDATGSETWWEKLCGVQFESASPNPPNKQGQVVSEAFDITFRALTEKMVAINRPNALSSREFLGILQAIVEHHDAEQVSVVTSKAMREKVKDSQYADEVMDLAYADTILNFGGLRSDRTFEESPLHVVIGAPHPGDDAVRQRMALLGYDDRIVQDNYTVRGEDRYKGKSKAVLHDIVHSEVYQAARRAARANNQDETAYVYLYTSMFDETQIQADNSFGVEILGSEEKQKGGSEAILTTLEQASEPLETEEIVQKVNEHLGDNSLSPNRIREKLNNILETGLIEKRPWIQNKNHWTLEGSIQHGTLTEKAGNTST